MSKKRSNLEKAKVGNILEIPKADRPNWSVEDITVNQRIMRKEFWAML